MRGSSCARPQAAVPAVSENHPPVDRLLGGQHCGWLSEIRSEVSAPARLCPRNVAENRTLSSLLILGSGGRRLRTRAVFPSNGLGYGGLCPHPPRNLRFLGFSICCRLFGRRALLVPGQAQAITTMAQRRRLAPTLHQKRTPAGKPPPRRRSPRRLNAAAIGSGHCPPALDEWGRDG